MLHLRAATMPKSKKRNPTAFPEEDMSFEEVSVTQTSGMQPGEVGCPCSALSIGGAQWSKLQSTTVMHRTATNRMPLF